MMRVKGIGKRMNKLVSILASCDLEDITSLRRLYKDGCEYSYYGIDILCSETHKTTPECVKFTLRIPLTLLNVTKHDPKYDIILADFCLREFVRQTDEISLTQYSVTGKAKYTGAIYIYHPGPRILLRNVSYIRNGCLEIMFRIQFPVLMKEKHYVVSGRASSKIVKKDLARAIRNFIDQFDIGMYEESLAVYKRQQEIRVLLDEQKYLGFVANGSILPRGEGEQPLEGAVPFVSPKEDEVEIELSDGFILKGMAIREGVNVITGGGYSGKSTFLDSVLDGIYDHVQGDGREYCIARSNSCKIMAEEGRCISNLDISAFITKTEKLNTEIFSTQDASGSTSQAANIIEAVSFGCKTLFIDEDRTATNFMICDARMKSLIPNDPVIPFTDSVRQIYDEVQVSTILIIGGSSEYLDIADHIYLMTDYRIANITLRAGNTVKEQNADNMLNTEAPHWIQRRYVYHGTMGTYIRDDVTQRIRENLEICGKEILIGNYKFESAKIDTIITKAQLTTAALLIRAVLTSQSPCFDIYEEMIKIYIKLFREGFDFIGTDKFVIEPDMELPNMQDVLFALSRIRGPEVMESEEEDISENFKVLLVDEKMRNKLL